MSFFGLDKIWKVERRVKRRTMRKGLWPAAWFFANKNAAKWWAERERRSAKRRKLRAKVKVHRIS